VVAASKTGKRHTVRLLEPLAHDLGEWRMASGRPADDAPVIPRPSDGGVMSAKSFNVWRSDLFAPALDPGRTRPRAAVRPPPQLRLAALARGGSMIYVARQLGQNARYTLGTYGHVIDELDDAPQLPAEDAIRARARETFAPRSQTVSSRSDSPC
jgi:integrase